MATNLLNLPYSILTVDKVAEAPLFPLSVNLFIGHNIIERKSIRTHRTRVSERYEAEQENI